MPALKWTQETIHKEARIYRTRGAFRKSSSGAYNAALKLNILDTVCEHMSLVRRKLSNQDIADIAARYGSRGEFKRADESAYTTALNRGILSHVCAHMKNKYRPSMGVAEVASLARKYTSRSEFAAEDGSAYAKAIELNVLDTICTHMKVNVRNWTDHEIADAAAAFTTRIAFQNGNKAAYLAAHRAGILDRVCSHMAEAHRGFNAAAPATVYYLRIVQDCSRPLYKIGVTNKEDVINRWSRPCDREKITVLKTWAYAIGAEALKHEREVCALYKDAQYVGPKFLLGAGHTELFTKDVLGLDPEAEAA